MDQPDLTEDKEIREHVDFLDSEEMMAGEVETDVLASLDQMVQLDSQVFITKTKCTNHYNVDVSFITLWRLL